MNKEKTKGVQLWISAKKTGSTVWSKQILLNSVTATNQNQNPALALKNKQTEESSTNKNN